MKPVLVIGDCMLDRYWEGAVERISPEAPVPVLQVQRETQRAGGAANVALNLVALGSEVRLLSLVGEDEAGAQLSALMDRAGIVFEPVRDPGLQTTQKIRSVCRRQQLLRIDFEAPPPAPSVRALTERAIALLPQHDWVLLSDYAKGSLAHCAEFIAAAQHHGCRVLVDPKGWTSSATAAPGCSSPTPPSCAQSWAPGRTRRSCCTRRTSCGTSCR
jgi:rfaE bifunctional protein kinase chain/domain